MNFTELDVAIQIKKGMQNRLNEQRILRAFMWA